MDDIRDPDLLEAGSRQVLQTLVRGLGQNGFEVVVFLRGEGRFPDRIRALGAEVAPLDIPQGRPLYRRLGDRIWPSPGGFLTATASAPRAILDYARLFRRYRVDVVYLAHPLSHVLGGLGARLAGIPAVFHLQGVVRTGRLRPILPAYRAACLASGGTIVAISKAVADALGTSGARHPIVIPNGVDVERFRPRAPDPARFEALGLPPPSGGPIVGLLGTLEPIKRVHLLPALARRVIDARPDARFLVIGTDLGDPSGMLPGAPGSRPSPYVRRVLDGLRDEGIADRVVLAGRREDVPDLLAGMDVLVHLCEREGFGLALVEAGASEVPVVAFDAAGAAEVVADGLTGRLVQDPNDVAGMADRVIELLDAPATRSALGAAARTRVRERFSEASFVAAFCRLFRSLAAEHPARRR